MIAFPRFSFRPRRQRHDLRNIRRRLLRWTTSAPRRRDQDRLSGRRTITLQDLLTPIPDPADTSHTRIQMTINRITTSGTKFVLIERCLSRRRRWFSPTLPSISRISVTASRALHRSTGEAFLNGGGPSARADAVTRPPESRSRHPGSPGPVRRPAALRITLQPGTTRVRNGIAAGEDFVCQPEWANDVPVPRRGHTRPGSHQRPVMNEDLTRWDRLELKASTIL